MPERFDVALEALKAIAEETRLRIVAVLEHGELTVTDLTEILGQSQPRVSRHLRLLVDAGLVTKHREGTWVFFRLVESGSRHDLARAAIDSVATDDSGARARTSPVSTRSAPVGRPPPASTSSRSLRSGTRSVRCTPQPTPSKR